jgi:protein-tyrosine-phosphatase
MKKILFVCVQNSGRSQMAEAFFNHMAQGKAISYSAGTNPAEQVNPVVTQVMEEMDISMTDHKPKPLTPDMLQDVDLVITMGCGADGVCPASFVQTDDWDLEDPKDKPVEEVRKIRDEIKRRVSILVKDLR